MARPREFDIDEVLCQVMETFWREGYEKTSFAMIEERTGVKKASLCAAFGDKRSLFLKALRYYQESSRETCLLELNEGTPSMAVRNWLTKAAQMATGENAGHGCFQVNSIIELATHDPDVAALVKKHSELTSAQIAKTIRRGQRAGEFRADVEALILAKYLVASLYGLMVAGKAATCNKEIEQIVDVMCSALEK